MSKITTRLRLRFDKVGLALNQPLLAKRGPEFMIIDMPSKRDRTANSSTEIGLCGESAVCCKNDVFKVFDKPCFLEQLRKERFRSQRSGSPLSLLLVTQDKFSTTSIREVSQVLHGIIRETDSVGYIDATTLGVLLPYTDQEGVKKAMAKVNGRFINPQFSIASATFPDQIFDNLVESGCVSSDVLKLVLEDTIKHSAVSLLGKRLFDIVAASLGLILLSPLLLLVALLIKATSSGPIIFKQKRLGLKGAPFTFYKFRSMRTGVSDKIHREFVLQLIDGKHEGINNGSEENPLYKLKVDPRITRIGGFIRKTSIDELPQLFNVLIGDMSLVGPRPPLAYEAEKYQSWHLRRLLEMKPGITGLWQVEGRSRTSFDDAVRLDVRYLQTWSFGLDINILIRTVKEVLQCRGAV